MIRTICVVLTAGLLSFAGCSTAPKAKSLSDAQSHSVMLGTNKVHYVTVGHGNHTLVLVHCWCGNINFWRDQVPALSDKASLVLIDLPGHGLSDKPQTAYTMDYFASAVIAVMKDAHVDQATLIGHSMGGPVICRAYHQAPEKVLALVSVDGLMRPLVMPPQQAATIIASFRSPAYREAMKSFVGSMFPVPGTEKLRDQVTAEMLKPPQHVIAGAMEGMFDPKQPDWNVKQVSIPVLVINAKGPFWDATYEDFIRSLSPKAEYTLIDGAGHWMMMEKPAEFNATLVAMLQKYDLIAK